LLDEITTLVARSAPVGASASVLDVSCGTGTVARASPSWATRHRRRRRRHLGRRRTRALGSRGLALTFEHRDIAADPPSARARST